MGSAVEVGRQIVGRTERRCQLGEQRAVRLERLLRPLLGSGHGGFGGGNLQLHHVGDVESGDLGEFVVLDAHGRVDVGRCGGTGTCEQPAAAGRDHGELPCGVPVERALSGQCPRQVTEQRHPGERIDRLAGFVFIGHGAMLRVSGCTGLVVSYR